MSLFTYNRNNTTSKIEKKTLNLSTNPKINNNRITLSNNNGTLNLSVLSLSGIPVTSSGTKLNYVNSVTNGIGLANKALITDNSNNISSINSLSCNQLIINGNTITISNNNNNSGASDSNSPYLQKIKIGQVQNSKALVLDTNKNIETINTLSSNQIILSNNNKIINTYSKSINKKKIHPITLSSINTTFANNLINICWSSELLLAVAISNTGTNRLMTSPDGINWTTRTIPVDNDWTDICWSSELGLFVVISNNGTNRIMYSSDGINWNLATASLYPTKIFSGSYSTYIFLNDNSLLVTGNNEQGRLGNGNTTQQKTLNRVTNIPNLLQIKAGYEYTLFLFNNNTVKSWGNNTYGQLGIGNNTAASSLTTISNLSNVIEISVSKTYYHSVALISDGTIKSWGLNSTGQLGNDSLINSNVPVTVTGIDNAIAISAGYNHTLALLSDGTIKSWGSNSNGQLGDNSTTQRTTPVTVSNINNAIAISAGDYFSLALLSDGTIKSWGINTYGQLGNNSTIQSLVPVTVLGITNAIAISAGGDFSLALLSDGTVQAWGRNNYNQLGESTATSQRLVPNTISGLNNVIYIEAAHYQAYVILSDKSIYRWGLGNTGQLGNDSNNNITTPTIMPENWSINTSAWSSVCWSPQLNLFAAVANNGNTRVMISNNGIDWTIQKAAVNNNWTSVCWSPELNLFAAVANSGTTHRIMYSSNGITWTSVNNSYLNDWISVVWVPRVKLFIAISNTGVQQRIMTSSNGTTWTVINSPYSGNWVSICDCPQLNITVAIANLGYNRLIYTYNGTEWFLGTSNLQLPMNHIIWAKELNKFLITSNNSYSYSNITYANSNLMTTSNWYSLFTYSKLNNSTYSAVQSGTNPDVELQINSNSATSTSTSLWYNQRIQDATTFTINFEIKLSGSADATSFNIGYINNSFYADGPNKSAFCLAFQLYSPNKPIGIYLYDDNGTEINYYSYNLNENTWRTVQIIYTNSTTNTWQFYFNNVNIFNYSNPNHSSWISNSGSFFGFGSRNSGLAHNSTIRRFTLSGNFINSQTTNTINSRIINSQTFNNELELTNYGRNLNVLNNGDAMTLHKIIGNTSTSQQFSFHPSQIIWINELNIYLMGNTSNNNIAYSSDGFNWIVTTTITGFFIKSLCWSPQLKLIVAVSSSGSNNNVITSPDGINWTLRTNVPTNIVIGWYGVCWSPSLNLFVAVGYGAASSINRVMTSSDGITWTLRKAGYPNCNWSDVCWSSELNIFVAISNSGNSFSMYSYNGIDWYTYERTYGSSSNAAFTSICWSPELNLFAAVSADRVIISSDGIHWSYRNVNNNNWQSICWASGLEAFIAVSTNTSNNLMYSIDGLTWYYKSLSPVSDSDLNAICWSDTLNIFTAVGYAKVLNYPLSNQNYGPNSFSNSNNLSYFNNYDNVYNQNIYNTWYNTSTNVNNQWTSICYASDLNLLVAVSKTGSNNRIITSSDGGYNWISRTTPVDNNWTSICYSTELTLFVAVANTGTNNRIMTSSDSITWTIQTNPIDNDWTCVCYSSDLSLFVAISNTGTNNRVMTSSDGITWTSRTSAADNNWTSICWAYNLNLFVAVANSGTNRVMTSPNGINWTLQTTLINNNWTSICWSNKLNLLIAVANSGTNNRIMISSDGINWSTDNIIYKSISSNKNISMNSIFASKNYSLSIHGDSTIVKGWGWDSSNYSTGLGNLPVIQTGLTNVKKIVGSQNVIKILLNDGTVQNRGTNNSGEIGNISLNTAALYYITPPYTVPNITNAIDIATGNNFTLVLLSDGTIKSWGANVNGQLGNNSNISSFTPVSVSNISNVINISAHPESYHSLALLNDGTVMSWGLNTNGQLGDNSTTQRLIPVAVSDINNVIAISAGINHSLALLSDGTIKSWGLNSSGQLGNNSTIQSIIPVTVLGITNAIAISAGGDFSLALLSNGTVMAWGKNDLGQLGIGNNVNQLEPTLISNLSNIIGLSAGSAHTLALVNDGTLRSWGYNNRGQLGNNTTTTSNIPITVLNSSTTSDILTNIKIDKLINTNYTNNNWISICWSDEMNVFVAISNTGTLNRIMVSNDGYTWYPKNSIVDNNWTSICWADLISKFIIISSDGNNNILYSNIGKPNLLSAVTTLGTSQIGNNVGSQNIIINTSTGSSRFNIGADSNNKILRLSYNNSSINSVDFISSFTPNYQIDIINNSNNKIINIANHNGSTYGLSLNSTLISTTANDLNKLKVSTFGQAEASKALIINNNLNISNINNISLNKLIVNNKIIFNSTDNNSEYFNDITPGTVSTNKALIVDSNNNIELLNKIDSNELYLNKFNNMRSIIKKNTFDSTGYYLNNFQPMQNQYPNNLNYNQIIWISDLNLFIGTGGLYEWGSYVYSAASYGINISTDGINWKNAQSLQYIGNSNPLYLAYSPSLKIIAGYTMYKGYYSYDGYTWYNTSYPTSNPSSLTSICWADSLNLFVAVTGTTNLMTSSDGINWTFRTPLNSNNWTGICWSQELSLLVAVSSSGTGNRVMTSTNGINWTSRTSAVDNNWTSVCWSAYLSLFVAVSNTGTTNRVMTSSNGISWTSRTSASNSSWNSVIWCQNLSLFIAVSTSFGSNNSIMKSSNGINWSTISTTNIDAGYKTITYSPQLNLLVAGSFGANSSYFYNKVITSSNGSNTWTLQDTSYDLYWFDMIYISELSLFITVSNAGNTYSKQYAISTNGIDWTLGKIDSSVSSKFRSLAWSSTLSLLIVCYNNGSSTTTFYRTSDCINWISVTVPSGAWVNVKWISELGMFIAVASSGTNRMITSTNGINWSVMSSYTSTQALYNIEYASSLNMLIAVGNGTPAIYFTSIDGGNSWTQRSLIINNSNITISGESNITWINQISKFYYYQQTGTIIYISSDGINWTSIDLSTKAINTNNWTIYLSFPAFTTGKPIWIPELNKLYVIAGGHGASLLESSDGINWVTKCKLSSLTKYNNLCWADSIKTLIGFGPQGALMAGHPFFILNQYLDPDINYNLESINNLNKYSNNQINKSINTWISRTSAANNNWTSICFSRELNLFVAVSNTGTNNRVMTSSDSITWTSRTSAADNNWTSICYSPELNLFVAVSNSGTGNRVMTSSDGITWTSRTSAADNNWTSICWANDLQIFVAISNSGTNNRIMTSSNGINWEIRTSPADNDWTSICWSNELTLLVAVANTGTNNRIMTSSDGITWTIRTNPIDNDWTSICWAPELNLFVAVSNTGTNDRVMTSSDGITWISRVSAVDNNWTSICWANRIDRFIAVSNTGTNNRIMISADGINWTSQSNSINNDWTSICWSMSYNLAVIISNTGTNNRVLTSTINIPYNMNNYPCSSNTLYINQTNGNIGLGKLNPNYQLELSTDSAAKPSTAYWTISSDSRLKDNIEDANLDICYDNIKNLRLVEYTWKDNIYPNENVTPIYNIDPNIIDSNNIDPNIIDSNNSDPNITDSNITDPNITDSNITDPNITDSNNSDPNITDPNITDSNITDSNITDSINRTQLGWIADEVEQYLPKSIKKINAHNLKDCKTLDSDQIIASMYGAIKKLIIEDENMNDKILLLKNNINGLENYIDELKTILN
jgi:alpha-tubulin suppressor-like RCC1 family protein